MAKYTSGRQKNLKIGISSYSENLTSLEVIGKVGIGTTNAGGRSLYVIGDGAFTGIVTAVTFNGNVSAGAATITTLNSTFGTITNLTGTGVTYTSGTITNLTGTAATITTLNSTNGTITNLTGTAATITTLNSTNGTITNLTGTAATITNLTGTAATITTLNSTNGTITTLNSTNGTITNLIGTAATITTLNSTNGTITNLTGTGVTYTSGTITTLSGSNLYYNSGIVTTLSGTNINYSGISTLGVTNTTNLTSQQLNVSGISTFTNGPILVGTATSTGTASQRLQVTGGAYVSGSVGIGTTNPTAKLHVIGDVRVSGIVTATTFVGALTGNVTGNLTGNINSSGVSTVTSLNATDINVSGIGTINTFRSNIGIITTLSGTTITYNTGNFATANINTGIVTTLSGTNLNYSGISTLGVTSTTNLTSQQLLVSGVSTFIGAITGTISTATKLQNARTFEITGDIVASPISFDGTSNVSLAATIQPNSVELGTDTFGDYVESISGTANAIDVTGGTGESSTPVISFAPNPTIGGNVTIGNDLQVNNNLNVTGNITVGGTQGYILVENFRVSDADIVLGFTTDSQGNDVSTDTTANHGGIAIASTEGNPLVNLNIAGIGTLPPTYKKIMWFKAGAFAGLNTDAWLSNYAIGIGSTQFPSGTRLAAGSVQFTENDLAVVRNINSSGIGTIPILDTTTGTIDFLSGTNVSYSGIATLGVTSTTNLRAQSLSVSGIVSATAFYGSGANLTGIATTKNLTVGTRTTSFSISVVGTGMTLTLRSGIGTVNF